MSGSPTSDFVAILKLNGDFKQNYGRLVGAFLFLCAIRAARGRSYFWHGLLLAACATGLTWLKKHGLLLLGAQ